MEILSLLNILYWDLSNFYSLKSEIQAFENCMWVAGNFQIRVLPKPTLRLFVEVALTFPHIALLCRYNLIIFYSQVCLLAFKLFFLSSYEPSVL